MLSLDNSNNDNHLNSNKNSRITRQSNKIKYPHVDKFRIISNYFGSQFRIFKKLDGTNCQISYDRDTTSLSFGSRNFVLTLEDDFENFVNLYRKNENFCEFFQKSENQDITLFGEFLCYERIKYKKEYLRAFLIFDVLKNNTYLDYSEYKVLLNEFNIDYIEPVVEDLYEKCLYKFHELIQNKSNYLEGDQLDEGFLIKLKGNFTIENKGKSMFKIVSDEFSLMAYGITKTLTNELNNTDKLTTLVDTYCTTAYIYKELYKLFPNSKTENELIEILKKNDIGNLKRIIMKDFCNSEISNFKEEDFLSFKKLIGIMSKKIDVLVKSLT